MFHWLEKNPFFFAVGVFLVIAFAGLIGGDTIVILKKGGGGDSNLSFTGGSNHELAFWDSN